MAEIDAEAKDMVPEPEAVKEGSAGGEAEAPGLDPAAPSGSGKRKREGPVKLGFKTLNDGEEACFYFRNLMRVAPTDTNLNQYEHNVLYELLRQGHPNADKKIGSGLAGFQVREFNSDGALAFYVVRTDGTSEDFSYLKCLGALFSDVGREPHGGGQSGHSGGGRGGGRGRGRGGGGREGGRGGGLRGRGRRGRGRGEK